jgi:hypothetical protein
MTESREQKFKLLAERRVNNAIKQLRLVGNLANPSAYEYDDAQIKKIVSTLNEEIATLKSRFASVSRGGKERAFSL